MAHAVPEDDGDSQEEEKKPPPSFGGTIFLQQGAHVAVLDGRGRIIAVNDAWSRFGSDNGLDPAYQFVGASYPEICERAIDAERGGEGAREALGGINKVLALEERRFSLVYPCHAPDQQRWFLMYARPIGQQTTGAVVSHIDVTSLHGAGLVPDETARASDAASSRAVADKLAQLLFHSSVPPSLAEIAARLR